MKYELKLISNNVWHSHITNDSGIDFDAFFKGSKAQERAMDYENFIKNSIEKNGIVVNIEEAFK